MNRLGFWRHSLGEIMTVSHSKILAYLVLFFFLAPVPGFAANFELYLPAERSQAATEAFMSAIGKSPIPAVTFMSAESSLASRTPIVNRVSFFASKEFDVWLMRQKQSLAEGQDPEHWSLVAILVDRKLKPPQAYYLEFEAKPLSPGRLSSTVGSEAWNSRDLKSRPH